ncbi:aspartyl-phosphate phosphatase Spo0E family protein [Peribacillus loiseleuriae]|uniref:Aspartyl-phosphate phosphatase Spo0E family protein n=1 Tax=Peribacillus loiseleuriae TaxID=1679170 RepID=A0A0K9GTP3_9BACI|nr:aspartyl-phosphate phosphatase Spo0E family protein [Peribacillus loiseleuriae]KMY49996.1 hypothetical protein AC625_11135 [Peribacillus loiseleuriae]
MIIHLRLLDKIENKRKEMLQVASKAGLNRSKTIKCSQELDNILNLHILDKEIIGYDNEIKLLLLDARIEND